MPVKIFQPSQHKEAIKQFLRETLPNYKGSTEQLVKEAAEKWPLSERTIYRYHKEVKDELAGRGTEDKQAGTTKTVTQPTQFAVVTTKTPGPIVFIMGDQRIDLNPEHLYDAWRYCEDIKRIDPLIDDDFSLMLKAACKYAWEIFSEREARRLGANVELVEEVR